MANGVNRMRRMVNIWKNRNISIVGLQELETPQVAVLRAMPNWAVVRAKTNSPLRWGNTMGNGIAYNRRVWKRVGKRKHININMPGRPRGINFVAITLKHKESDKKLNVLVFHNPRVSGKDGNTAKVRREAKRAEVIWARDSAPAVLLGDSNEGSIGSYLRKAGLKVGNQHGVDVVAGKQVTFDKKFHVSSSYNGTLSDHPLVGARVKF